MENVIIKAKIKEYVKNKYGVAIAEDFFSELNLRVVNVVDRAVVRARANKRNTLKPRDA